MVLAYGLIQGHAAFAATSCTFASVGTSLWDTAANWTCNDASHNVPTSTVDVLIPTATSTTLTDDFVYNVKSINIQGTLVSGLGSVIHVNGDWTRTGVFTPSTGTVDFAGTAVQTVGAETFNNLDVTKSSGSLTATGNIVVGGTLTTGGGGGTFNMDVNALSVTGISTIGTGTTVTSTSGTLTFTDAVSNTGNIGSSRGDQLFSTSLTMNTRSTFSVGAGYATSSGSLGERGAIKGNSGLLSIAGNFTAKVGGAFDAGTGTVKFFGTADQLVAGYTFNNLKIYKSTGTVSVVGLSTAINGTLQVTGGGSIFDARDMTVAGVTTIDSGSTVTSTNSGAFVFNSPVTNAGSLSSFTGTILFSSSFENFGTFDVGVNTVTTTGSFTGTGVINGNSGMLAVRGYMTGFSAFNCGTGTLKLWDTTDQNITGAIFNNVLVTKDAGRAMFVTSNARVLGDLTTAGSSGTLSSGLVDLTVNTTFINGSGMTVTSTSGALTFASTTNNGSLGTNSGTISFNATTTNNGTLSIGNSGAIVNDLHNNGTINGNSGILNVFGVWSLAGTFNAQEGGVYFGGSRDQDLPAFIYHNLGVNKSGGTLTMQTSVTTTNDVVLLSGNFSVPYTLSVGRNWTDSGAVVSGSGTVRFNGSGAQSIGAEANFPNVEIRKSGGSTATLAGTITVVGNFALTSGTFAMSTRLMNVTGNYSNDGGTLDGGTGTLRLTGMGAQTINTEPNFYGLMINKGLGTATLIGNVSTTNFAVVAGTFAVADKIFYAPVVYSNAGLVTRTTGKIKHAASYKNFVNASGVTQTSYTTPGAIYLEVKDDNRNMNGAAVETLTVPLAVNAAGGGDSETVTLTETGVATGVFRSGLVGLYTGTSIVPGNGEVVISASGIGTETYTDNQDATDTGATTATLTYSTGVVTPPGGGGGGGGGGGLPPVTTQFQSETSDPNRTTYLNNLALMNLPVNSLVKLPDDNNGATQEDSAVYYIGSDGKRHAFPNSKIFFTWYKDFSGVRIITAEQLASIPLGTNVRYKPGSRMVKFTTDPKVYAVDANGVLRWVKTEAAAKALYGDNWNAMIDDMSDAFFSNYSFGKDIETSADFNVSMVLGLEQTINDNLVKNS